MNVAILDNARAVLRRVRESKAVLVADGLSKVAQPLPADLMRPVTTEQPSYLKTFAGGLDPRGTVTLELGRRTDPKYYTRMQTLGTVGGALGGGLLIPGLVGAAAGGIAALRGGAGARKSLRAAWRSAADIYRRVWGAGKASRILQHAARTGKGLTAAERKAVQRAVSKNITLSDIWRQITRQSARPMPDLGTLLAQAERGRLPKAMTTPLIAELRRGTLTGGLAIGGAGGISGYSAYKQYKLGQRLRRQEEAARRGAQQAYRRGMVIGKTAGSDGMLKVSLLPQYDPVPMSSLTAVSDFAANRRFGPKAPNPLTSEEQATLENLLAGMSKSRARVVDARRRARNNVVRLRSLFAASGLWG